MCQLQKLIKKVSVDIEKSKRNLLQQLFIINTRLGFEIGRIFKIFMDNDLNWGFFADHNPYGNHCNAHLNNFAVLPPN